MYVVKRDGTHQSVCFDKVSLRIRQICSNQDNHKLLTGVNCDMVALKIISQINDGISTSELDTIGASIVQPLLFEHPDYGELASRLLVSNHHKNCNQLLLGNFCDIPDVTETLIEKDLFYWTCRALWENINMNGNHSPMIAPHVMKFVENYHHLLEPLLKYNRDYNFTYPGFELAYGSYLLQCCIRDRDGYHRGETDLTRYPIERPQHMWLRVALGIWLTYPVVPYRNTYEIHKQQCQDGDSNFDIDSGRDPNQYQDHYWNTVKDNCVVEFNQEIFDRIARTYEMLSQQQMMHATPTLFHSGMITPQLASCFLTTIRDDSLEAIADSKKNVMMISKHAGGIGSHWHHIRPKGSYIGGTGGTSNGLIPMSRCFNEISKYVDQGGSKRPGSHAIYLELWHGDIEAFIDIRKRRGNQEHRSPQLFNALWICDEFMRAVEEEERRIKLGEKKPMLWYLMDPSRCRGLPDNYDQQLRIRWITDEELAAPDAADRWRFTVLYRKYIREGKYMKRVSASDLWKQVCEVTEETSLPYKVHKDAANRKSNQKNLGTIKSSNLCVAGETKILTDAGYCEIQSLVGKDIKVWNGFEFSDTQIVQTSDATELMKIKFSNGMKLECTKAHKFHIQVGDHVETFNAEDLKYDMQIMSHNLPTGDTNMIIDEINEMISYAGARVQTDKYSIEITHGKKTFLRDILLQLQTIGIYSDIYLSGNAYILYIYGNEAKKLSDLGFLGYDKDKFQAKDYDPLNSVSIIDIIYTGRIDKTYCFNEPIRHLGMFNGILAGNCTEIIEYSSGTETAVCNLASICLDKYVVDTKPLNADQYPESEGFPINTDLSSDDLASKNLPGRAWFDFASMNQVVKDAVVNLNKVIDQNYYPTAEGRLSNMRHRPIGVGVQGLADCFAKLWLPYDSAAALKLDFYIFEHLDFACKESSISIAKHEGQYSTFIGSPASKGKFQIDLWLDEYNSSDQKDVIPDWNPVPYTLSCDWERLSADVVVHGMRNSLGLAPMPTASTSTLTACSPAFEPFNAMLYKHTDKYGESFICNRDLQAILLARGLWTPEVRTALMRSRTGSIQDITTIPRVIRDVFKNAWDMSPKVVINHSLVRGVFVDQSQSLNWFVEAPTAQVITQAHFYAWKRGIKTGCYYLRRLPVADAKKIQLTGNPTGLADSKSNSGKDQDPNPDDEPDGEICTMREGCLVCSS